MNETLKTLLGWLLLFGVLACLSTLVVLGYLGIRRVLSRRMSRRHVAGLIALLIIVPLGISEIGHWLTERAIPPWAAYPLAVLILVAGFLAAVFVMALCTRKGRRALGAIGRFCLRERESLDFAAARRAAGKPGSVARAEHLTLWSDIPDGVVPALERAFAAAAQAFSELTGRPATMRKPVRLLSFETEAAFAAYTQPMFVLVGRARGHYSGIRHKRITLCRELGERFPWRVEEIVAHELTHHLMRLHVNKRLRPWLDEGLSTLLASRLDGGLRGAGAHLRWCHAAMARGQLLAADKLFAVSRRKLAKRGSDWSDLAAASFVETVYVQGASFLRFLHERQGEAFRRFFSKLPSPRRVPGWFRECFGRTPGEAMGACLAELKAAQPPPFQAPPDEAKGRIERELAAPILDRGAPSAARRLAIRAMGGTGYPWRADALVATLDDPDESLRAEACRALENLAGELRGTEPQPWRGWLASLPPIVVK